MKHILLIGLLGTLTACTGTMVKIDTTLIKAGVADFYPTVSGTVELEAGSGSSLGYLAKVTFYSDEYETVITSVERRLGESLDEQGDKEVVSISSYEVYILPANNGYAKVCATIEMPSSNAEEAPLKVGCVEGTEE